MKIVLANYRYFISGGPERYYFNIKEVLERNGHEVIPFSIKGSRNFPCDYERYFLDTVDDEVYFAKSKKSLRVVMKSFTRMFFSFEAKRKFAALLDEVKPDLVYVMQYHNKISPSILYAAKKAGVPVVHRISDFQYMCPNALFYNDATGICEDCLKGKRMSCVRNRCVLGSRAYSAIKMTAKLLHDKLHVTRKVDAFVVPSSFTLAKLNEYGIPADKLHHVPTFFNLRDNDPEVTYEPFILYVGRIEKQKGLMTLVKAFAGTGMKLKIIGFSNDGYDAQLKAYLQDNPGDVEFLGRMKFDEIESWLKRCRATVVPSEWYDNFPNVILESFAYKKAVIASDLGSLPELVDDGRNGLLFTPGDENDLRRKARKLLDDTDLAATMGENAFHKLKENYLSDRHYDRLISLFKTVTEKN